MKRGHLLNCILFYLIYFGLLSGSVARSEIYQFIDQDGTLHFTNVPTDPRYKRLHLSRGADASPRYTSKVFQQAIHNTSRHYQVDPDLVKAVIQAESNFNPHAVSSAGALGLMQLMPQTAHHLEVADPFNPEENITGGVRHLRYLIDLFNGELVLALAAYNAGEDFVQRYKRVPPFPETLSYVRKVIQLYERYKKSQPRQETVYRLTTSKGRIIYTHNPETYRNPRYDLVASYP